MPVCKQRLFWPVWNILEGGGGKRVRLVLSRISKHLFDGRHGESHERVCKSLRIPLHTQLESPVCSTTPSSMHTVHLLNAAFVLTTSQHTLTCQHRLQQHCSNRIFRVHVFFPPSTSMIPIESGAFNFSYHYCPTPERAGPNQAEN